MPRAAKVMFGYALFLFVCGFLGWASTGFESKAKTAIASGTMTAAIMTAMGWLATGPRPGVRRTGRWLGTFFAFAFALVFTWRGLVGWALWPGVEQAKPLVATLISTMAVVSYGIVVTLLVMRGDGRNAPS